MESREFSEPFRHWVLNDVVPVDLLQTARLSVPSVTHPDWIRYENDCEKHKWTIERNLPSAWNALLEYLEELPLASLTGIPDLKRDSSRRGAGLHVTMPGGFLAPHLDYALHPSGLERRANLILFLTDESDDSGRLTLYQPNGLPIRSFRGVANQAIVFECGETSYHGVERLAKTAKPRLTAAAYYLAPARPGTIRQRAMFLPPR